MKKYIVFFLIMLMFTITMCDNKPLKIKTNYYDLPAEKTEVLKSALKTGSRNELTKESVEKLSEFLNRTLLRDNGPFGPYIISNYFWYIYNALPSFVDERERHNGYYKEEEKPAFKEQLLAYSCYRIDRSPENLNKIFNLIKPELKKFMPYEKYRAIKADSLVNGLIISYEEIIRVENYKQRLSEFYSSVYTPQGSVKLDVNQVIKDLYSNSAYGFSSYELSGLLCDHLNIGRHSGLYGSLHISFWMRRNHEGNMETVYSILKELEQIYRDR